MLLGRISQRYRNGGVHEHVIGFAVCMEAIDNLLMIPEAGLKQFIVATRTKQT